MKLAFLPQGDYYNMYLRGGRELSAKLKREHVKKKGFCLQVEGVARRRELSASRKSIGEEKLTARRRIYTLSKESAHGDYLTKMMILLHRE